MRRHLAPVSMAIVNKTRNDTCWRGCGDKGTLAQCCWECKLVQHYGGQCGGSAGNWEWGNPVTRRHPGVRFLPRPHEVPTSGLEPAPRQGLCRLAGPGGGDGEAEVGGDSHSCGQVNCWEIGVQEAILVHCTPHVRFISVSPGRARMSANLRLSKLFRSAPPGPRTCPRIQRTASSWFVLFT